MMDPALEPFADAIRAAELKPPQIPIISTVTGQLMSDSEAVSVEYWSRQIREPVRFSQALQHTLLEHDSLTLLEVGPSQTLCGLTSQQRLGENQKVYASLPHAKANTNCRSHILMTLGELWSEGRDVNWSRLNVHRQGRRSHLPGYAFERQSYWFGNLPPANRVADAAAAPQPEAQASVTQAGDPEEGKQAPYPPEQTVLPTALPTPPHPNTFELVQQQMSLMQQQATLLRLEQQRICR